jgi:two-component system chemotaxis response regulator CheB
VGVDIVENLGNHTVYSCPDCGGGLWEIKEGKTPRYRCYVGHSYSEADLLLKQSENIEATLWVALRMLEERRNLHKKLAGDMQRKGFVRLSADHKQRGDDLETHVEKLKEILFSTQNNIKSQ